MATYLIAISGKTLDKNRYLEACGRRGLLSPSKFQDCRPVVTILDAPSQKTLTVSWRDACSGNFGYQTWRLKIARASGRCVLTGQLIMAGELTYAPKCGKTPPANARAMLLAKHVHEFMH
ncbi:DUF3331 domain-containing protein [Caballeronia zhejiangensis]|uniref:DUF3331 domain-containing protein n=1 Tax=Burkholderiaceae TaxID=119060 RepID=UPI0009B4B7E8